VAPTIERGTTTRLDDFSKIHFGVIMIVTVITAGKQTFEAPDNLPMHALRRQVARRFGQQAPFVDHSFAARLDAPLPEPVAAPSFSDGQATLSAPLHHWPHERVYAAG
jgi:hypothetical protein